MACAAAGLTMASGAMAQERQGCAIYDELLAAAPSGFAELRGEPMPGTTNGFQATKMLPGMFCAIADGEASAFACLSEIVTEAQARRSYELRLARLRSCFDGWETAPLLDVPGSVQAAASLRFIRRADGGLLSIGAMAGFEEVEGVVQWRAAFGVSWKPDDVAV